MNSVQKRTLTPLCVCSNGFKKAFECDTCYLDFFGGLPVHPGLPIGKSHLAYNFMFEDVIYSCVVTLLDHNGEFDTLVCRIQNIPGSEKTMTNPETSIAKFYKEGAKYTAVTPDPYAHFDGPDLLIAVVNYHEGV